jgi:LmbE family N-acetylglucosaminyl deacetylase
MSENQRIPYHASSLAVPAARGVLIVAPHPDDEVFGCGGSAALFARAGVPVQALILTDGGLGGVAPAGQTLVDARRAEARAAAGLLGCRPPLFDVFADRTLAAGDALAYRLADQVRASQADVLMAPSPWEVHPDHRACALAAIAAMELLGAGHMLVQYEVGAPLLPNVLLDITPVWKLKQQAMACFASQLAVQAYDRHVTALNVFRTYTLAPTVEAAEGLRVATPQEARDDPFGLVFQGHPHPLKGG